MPQIATVTGLLKDFENVPYPETASVMFKPTFSWTPNANELHLAKHLSARTPIDSDGTFTVQLVGDVDGLWYEMTTSGSRGEVSPNDKIRFPAPNATEIANGAVELNDLITRGGLQPPGTTPITPLLVQQAIDAATEAEASAVRAEAAAATAVGGSGGGAGELYNPQGIAAFRAAVANRDSAPANVILIGDSITEGLGASEWGQRVPNLLNASLRARYPATGATPGAGFIGTATSILVPDPPLTLVGGTERTTDLGIGFRTREIDNGDSITWPATVCDRIVLYFSKSDIIGGPATISIDGVDVGTINSVGSAVTKGSGHTWDSGALTSGSHVLSVRGTQANFPAYVDGARFFAGDYGKGVTVFDGARSGASTVTYTSTAADNGHWKIADVLAPDLTVVDLIVNDWINDSSAADYLTRLDTIIARAVTSAAGAPTSVLLVIPYKPAINDGGTDQAWDDMVAGIKARAIGNVSVYDLSQRWPALALGEGAESGVMFEDATPLHPNGNGHRLQADLFYSVLSTPAPPSTTVSGGFTVTDNGDGSATISSTSVTINGDGSATIAA